ncbi:MAG: hypothetical protein WD334_09855 [Chitinophagales bacterium]
MNKIPELLFSLLIAFFSLQSCSYSEGTFTAKADDVFTLELPNYLSSTRQLAPGAQIQFKNRYRTVYVVGLYDAKGEAKDLDAYDERVIERFSMDLQNFESELLSEKTENGLTKRKYRLSGNTTGEKIEYLLLTSEDENHYYQVCVWTLDFRLEKYEEDLKAILASFERTK